MANRLLFDVSDVNDLLAAGYTHIQVHRSLTGVAGTYDDLTAASETGATLTGTIAGPFASLHDTTIRLRVGGVVTSVTFYDTNPIATGTAAAAIDTQVSGVAASDVGGLLRVTTDDVGTDATLEVLDGTGIDLLGFVAGVYATGKAARIALVEDVTSYVFFDASGGDTDYYKKRYFKSGDSSVSSFGNPIAARTLTTKPKQQADTRAARGLTLLRKTTQTFRHSFWNDSDATEVMAPLDAAQYPAFQIVDPAGQIVYSGVAELDVSAPNYKVEFFVPPDALLSNDDRRWRIEWTMVSDENRQVSSVTEFDVRDVDVTVSEERSLKLLAMPNERYRLRIRLHFRPYDLRLNIAPDTDTTNFFLEDARYPAVADLPEIVEVIDQDTFVYYYDIASGSDGLQASTNYTALWQIQQSIASHIEFAYQNITVPNRSILPHMTSVRMVIDKRQKSRKSIQAYTDADLYEYLTRGLGWLNTWHPESSYTMASLPSTLQTFWIVMASVYGANTQHLLQTELSFDFSGQSTTLNYDQTSGLDAFITRLMQGLDKSLTAAKTGIKRSANIAVTAVRPIRISGGRNRVYKIGSSNGGPSTDLSLMLTNLGFY